MPAELSALVWFATDDSSTSPRVPVFGSNRKIAEPYAGQGSQDGVVTPLLKLDLNKAFWVQNMVSNFCYYRWQDAYPVVRDRIDTIQKSLREHVKNLDDELLKLYNEKGAEEAVMYATRFSLSTANMIHEQWFDFYGELFVRFRDFHDITYKEDEPVCNCDAKEPGLSEIVKKRIIDETGNHYEVVTSGQSGHTFDFEEDILRATSVQ
jgi:dipeptidase